MIKLTTGLGGIEINYEKDADFPISIDGNLLYPSDISELYNFLGRVCKDEIIHSVVKSCDHEWIMTHSGHCRDCVKCGRQE